MVFSCAAAGTAAAARANNATKIPARRFMYGAPCPIAHAIAHANRASGDFRLRQAEAPFRQSLADAQSAGMSLGGQYQDGGPGKAGFRVGLRSDLVVMAVSATAAAIAAQFS